MNDNDKFNSAVKMLHKLKDAIRAMNAIPDCKITAIRFDRRYLAGARDPDWEQCKEVYTKIPFCRWLSSKFKFDEDRVFKIGDVQMRFKGGFSEALQLEVDGKWHSMHHSSQAAPFIVNFCCKEDSKHG